MDAPASGRLSPFKTYREFVAAQRDDADPGAFAKRYGEYRSGFARELARRPRGTNRLPSRRRRGCRANIPWGRRGAAAVAT